MSITRGIRNNNPGNIVRAADKWQGLAAEQPDEKFYTFETPEHGIRAMGKLLMNYQEKHGLQTINDLINRWAPPFENDTKGYAKFVADKVGVKPTDRVQVSDIMPEMVAAMITMENGSNPYDKATILRGCDMARKA